MIKSFLFIFFYLFIASNSFAQFLNLQITIEPELSATIEQDLDFGDVVTNSGIQEIELGDINMGVFRIRAYYTQNIFVSFITPNSLTHTNPSFADEIPINLNLAYNNTSLNSADAVTLDNGVGYIPLSGDILYSNIRDNDVWEDLELYVFGSIFIDNIANGIYEGVVVLNIDYD